MLVSSILAIVAMIVAISGAVSHSPKVLFLGLATTIILSLASVSTGNCIIAICFIPTTTICSLYGWMLGYAAEALEAGL